MAQRLKYLPPMQETWVPSLGLEDPLEKEMATQPVFLPGESHGRRSLVGYSPWGYKESDTTKRLHLTLPYLTLAPRCLMEACKTARELKDFCWKTLSWKNSSAVKVSLIQGSLIISLFYCKIGSSSKDF